LGTSALRKLASQADVVIENFRPGVMDRLGIGYETLSEEHPQLIYVAISGFGPDGPYREQPAYDMIIQAMSGFSKLLGSDDKPKLISNLMADKTSGMTAAWATMAALFSRERDGRGQRVDVSMLDAFASFVLPDAFGPYAFGEPPGDPALGEMIYRAWETADGHVACLAVEDHQFAALCKVMEREDLLADERYASLMGRIQNGVELFATMEVELRKFTTDELMRRAHEHGAPLGAVNDIDAFLADPQVQHNQTVFELEHPEAGPIALFRSAPRFQNTPSDVRRVPPKLGEHTEEVLREAGLTEKEIDALVGRPASN
ncbi:MAG: CoA transferase, partial [Deltaproteobacteria bacterium]|nr:CoA transferase [Deltaproteobacteria bacterium]